jgi:eukaryotic-like serine/threonine-protein kinase
MADSGAAPAAPAAPKEAATDPLIGRVFNDKFKILGFIARGGMGKVYRAEQAPLGRVCALKVLNANYTGEHDPEFHKRFFLEASMTSKLRHPNTVTIFDYGQTEDGIYYMAMEYLEGYTLHRAIRQAGHLTEERAAHIARQVCRSLREAHSLGVVHRDLKPANIYLLDHDDERDFVKVLDFGLVKNVGDVGGEQLTQAGLFMGSPKYMAPEQVSGGDVDARTDVYALGVILYEMLTGKVPFDRATGLEILLAHANNEPPPLRTTNPAVRVSTSMEETVMRALAKSRQDRFRSMDEMLAALRRLGHAAAAEPSGSLTEDRPSALLSGPQSGPQTSSVMSRAAGGSEDAPSGATDNSQAAGLEQPKAVPGRSKTRLLVPAAIAGLALAAGLAYARLHASPPAVVAKPASALGSGPVPQAPAPVSATAPAAPMAGRPESASSTSSPRGIAEVDVTSLSSAAKTPSRFAGPSASASPVVQAVPVVQVVPAGPAAPTVVAPRAAAPVRAPGAGSPALAPATDKTRDCNPSYYYDADGNKHFKPECFAQH